MASLISKTLPSRTLQAFLAGFFLWALLWAKAFYLVAGIALAIILCLGPFISIGIWFGTILGLYTEYSMLESIVGASLLVFAALAGVNVINFYTKKLRFAAFGDILTFFLAAIVFALILSISPKYFLDSTSFGYAFITILAYVSSFSPFFILILSSRESSLKRSLFEWIIWLGFFGAIIYVLVYADMPSLIHMEFLLLLPLFLMTKRLGALGAGVGVALLGFMVMGYPHHESVFFVHDPISGSLFIIAASMMAFLVSTSHFTMPTITKYSEIPLEHLLDALPFPIFYKNAKGSTSGYNRSFDEKIGTSKTKVLEILQRTPSSHKEITVLPFDNNILKDVQLTSAKILDSEKNLLGSVCSLHDITEFQLLHKSLQYWKERYELALDGANDGLWDWDIKSDKIFFSRRWKEIMGYQAHEKTDNLNHWLNLVHSSSMAKVNETLCAHLNGASGNLLIEHALKTKNTWVRVRGKAVFDKNSKPTRIVGYVSDITEERHFENEIRLFAQIFENTSEGILVTNSKANIITVNSAFCYLSGYTKKEAIGQNPRFRKSGKHSTEFYEHMWRTLLSTSSWRGEIYNRHKNGTITPEIISISTIKDETDSIMYFVGIFSNIAKQKEQEDKLHRLAHYDTLTKLPNRYLFLDRLNQHIAQHERSGSRLGLLFIDLDDFKPINDLHGHEAGDLVLKTIAARLSAIIRQSDTAARLAGDEFVVILANIETYEIPVMVSQKILTQLNKSIFYKGKELRVSASIGICIYPEHGEDTQALLHNADTAMYRVKHSGKNAIYIYGEEKAR